MSKKKFSDGLNDLFRDLPSESETAVLLGGESQARERRMPGKNFMHDLDALLQEAMDDALDQLESEQPAAAAVPSNKSRSAVPFRSPVSGLDALIRQTVDFQDLGTDEETGKKRLTVSVDRTKLEKLKTIARLENAYMKDILLRLIDDYIQEYGQKL
ncbi:MAG: hypothetical protein ACKVU2_03485 [Saprospiraceae bacterium]